MVNFDQDMQRRQSDAYKWNRYPDEVNPHWVADMDFAAPQEIIDAVQERVAHGVYGYALPAPSLKQAVQKYVLDAYDWQVDASSLIFLPGMVCGFNAACRATAVAGGKVLTMTPIYPPFLSAAKNFDQELLTVPMLDTGDGWRIDFAAFERTLQQGVELFLMCNPHNPVGRVYTREEMTRLTDLCMQYNVLISSDEIHCDLILDGAPAHIPTACISPEVAQSCITLMAPSKTYNIPGLACCFAIIENKKLRQKFKRAMSGIIPDVNILGLCAAEVAYTDCGQWLQELISYLSINRDILQARIAEIPGLRMHPVEATYLAWIDARGVSCDDPAAFFEQAGVVLSDGKYFGMPGFVRFNFGCTRALMEESLQRMAIACA